MKIDQKLIVGSLLIASGAALVIPDMLSTILNFAIGNVNIPMIGALTVGKVIGAGAVVYGIIHIRK